MTLSTLTRDTAKSCKKEVWKGGGDFDLVLLKSDASAMEFITSGSPDNFSIMVDIVLIGADKADVDSFEDCGVDEEGGAGEEAAPLPLHSE